MRNLKKDKYINQEYNNWKILEKTDLPSDGNGSKYLCVCKCGTERIVSINHIKYGNSKSCGCLPRHGKDSKHWRGVGDLSKAKFIGIQKSAKNRDIEFNITIEYVWDLFLKQDKRCALSGVELWFSSKTSLSDGNASLDRIDSNLGYISGNLQWIHKDINYMKQEYDEKYFVEMCKKIAQNPKPRVKIINDIKNLDLSGIEL